MEMPQLSRLVSTVFDMVETRLELIAVEMREEQQRFIGLLVISGLAICSAVAALLAATVGLVMLMEPEDRPAGMMIAAGIYALACLALWAVVCWRLKRREPPFAQTRAEFEKDRQWL